MGNFHSNNRFKTCLQKTLHISVMKFVSTNSLPKLKLNVNFKLKLYSKISTGWPKKIFILQYFIRRPSEAFSRKEGAPAMFHWSIRGLYYTVVYLLFPMVCPKLVHFLNKKSLHLCMLFLLLSAIVNSDVSMYLTLL